MRLSAGFETAGGCFMWARDRAGEWECWTRRNVSRRLGFRRSWCRRWLRGEGARLPGRWKGRRTLARVGKIVIGPEVGPGVVTGSTRLKAGTAQKMVLNMLSMATMARLGHVYENLMIDVKPSNQKVSARILRILAEASGKSQSEAEHALRQAGHNMRLALVMLKLGVGARGAKKKLAAANGDLREALGE